MRDIRLNLMESNISLMADIRLISNIKIRLMHSFYILSISQLNVK